MSICASVLLSPPPPFFFFPLPSMHHSPWPPIFLRPFYMLDSYHLSSSYETCQALKITSTIPTNVQNIPYEGPLIMLFTESHSKCSRRKSAHNFLAVSKSPNCHCSKWSVLLLMYYFVCRDGKMLVILYILSLNSQRKFIQPLQGKKKKK